MRKDVRRAQGAAESTPGRSESPLNARKGLSPRILLSLTFTTVLFVATAVPSQAQEMRTQPREHVVRRGDTLWDLARSYLNNPYLWPRIFDANRSVIRDPHWIYPDQRFMIPGLEDTVAVQVGIQITPETVPLAMPAGALERTRFYRPPPRAMEDTSETGRIMMGEAEPYAVTPYEYESAAWLADTASLQVRGRLIRAVDPASSKDKLASRLHPYDRVHVGRLSGAMPAVGDELLSIGIGREVGDHGRVITPLAKLVVDSIGEDVVIARIVKQYDATIVGDVVIPFRDAPALPRGAAAPITNGAEGAILEFREQEPLYGTTDQAFIDLGATAGIRVGDELVAYLPEGRAGQGRNAERLPATAIARMRVVHAEPGNATVRVLSVENTSLMRGYRVQVVGRNQ